MGKQRRSFTEDAEQSIRKMTAQYEADLRKQAVKLSRKLSPDADVCQSHVEKAKVIIDEVPNRHSERNAGVFGLFMAFTGVWVPLWIDKIVLSEEPQSSAPVVVGFVFLIMSCAVISWLFFKFFMRNA